LALARHSARETECRERALVAAQALRLGEDSLIVANLQVKFSERLFSEAAEHTADEAQRTALQAKAAEHFLAAAAALQQRRAADTLMPGCCRAVEVKWSRLTLEHANTVQSGGQRPTVARAGVEMRIAPSCGFNSFCGLGCGAVSIIVRVFRRQIAAAPQLVSAAWDAIADAAILFTLPSVDDDVSLGNDAFFVSKLRTLVNNAPELWAPMDAPRVRALVAWRSLERSGVLQRRNMDGLVEASSHLRIAEASAAAAARMAPERRSCSLDSCGTRETHPAHFKSCAACRIPVYCCKEHQTEHWPSHKAACKAARKAAAA
jgi:hypothetical protein